MSTDAQCDWKNAGSIGAAQRIIEEREVNKNEALPSQNHYVEPPRKTDPSLESFVAATKQAVHTQGVNPNDSKAVRDVARAVAAESSDLKAEVYLAIG